MPVTVIEAEKNGISGVRIRASFIHFQCSCNGVTGMLMWSAADTPRCAEEI